MCCSVAQSCLSVCDPIDCSIPGFLVIYYLPEFAQTHVRWVSDAIQPSHLLLPLSPLTLNVCQYQGSCPVCWHFISGGQNIAASATASVLPRSIQSWFLLGLASWISLLSKGLSGVFSSTTVQKHQFSRALPSLRSSSYNWHITLCKFKVWHVVFIYS